MESNKFLHDRQTCVIVIRGSFVCRKGLSDHSHSSFMKKRGIRTKISVDSWFIGCRFDSSERSFGRTLVSKENMAAVIYKHGRESGVTMKILGGVDFGTPPQPSHHCAYFFYPLHVSSLPVYFGSRVTDYRRHVPTVVNVSIYLELQQPEESRYRVGVILVDHCCLSGVRTVRGDRVWKIFEIRGQEFFVTGSVPSQSGVPRRTPDWETWYVRITFFIL